MIFDPVLLAFSMQLVESSYLFSLQLQYRRMGELRLKYSLKFQYSSTWRTLNFTGGGSKTHLQHLLERCFLLQVYCTCLLTDVEVNWSRSAMIPFEVRGWDTRVRSVLLQKPDRKLNPALQGLGSAWSTRARHPFASATSSTTLSRCNRRELLLCLQNPERRGGLGVVEGSVQLRNPRCTT